MAKKDEKKSVLLYATHWRVLRKLSMEQRDHIFHAIFALIGEEEMPELDFVEDLVFTTIQENILDNIAKWEETRAKRAVAGAKGGRKKASNTNEANASNAKQCQANEANASNAKHNVNVNDNVNDNVNVNVNDKEKRKKEKAVTASSDCSAECSTNVEPSLQKSKKEANEHFEKLWALYPTKKGKNLISDKRKRDLLSVSVDEMQCFINRYKRDIEADHNNGFARQWLNGSTWFNGRWQDYTDDNYQPAPTVTVSKGGARYRSVEGFRDFSDLEE